MFREEIILKRKTEIENLMSSKEIKLSWSHIRHDGADVTLSGEEID